MNVRELDKLDPPFDQSLVAFGKDKYHGRVFVADIFISHRITQKSIVKLIYVISENTSFAFNFLLKNNIKVKYAIHCRYGHAFGGGLSCGAYMQNILKGLNTKYLISDIVDDGRQDLADSYLIRAKEVTIPIVKRLGSFSKEYDWVGGYNDQGDMKFYEVVDHHEIDKELLSHVKHGHCIRFMEI